MNDQNVDLLSSEFQPKNEFVLVKPKQFDKEKVTSSGIIYDLEQNRRPSERPTFGEVIEVGEDIKEIKVGTFVVWPETDGLDLQFNDGKFVLLRYKSIAGSKK